MLDQSFQRLLMRRLRFSVRQLLILILMVGGCLGWVIRSERIQREAVAILKKNDALVWYNWECKDGKYIPNGEPWAPKWLLDYMGVDFFSHVVLVQGLRTDVELAAAGRLPGIEELSLSGSLTDAALVNLRSLTSLKRLSLHSGNITNAGLVNLKDLTSLETLELGSDGITDAGMEYVADLPSLRELCLNCSVGDAGLKKLNGRNNIELLALLNTQITDDGLAVLEGWTRLKRFVFIRPQFTDAGLAHLKNLTQMTYLDVSSSRVTDAGLASLEGLTRLEELWLANTRVTEAGLLAHLKGLTQLKELGIPSDVLTASGLRELQSAMPKLDIPN